MIVILVLVSVAMVESYGVSCWSWKRKANAENSGEGAKIFGAPGENHRYILGSKNFIKRHLCKKPRIMRLNSRGELEFGPPTQRL